MKTPYGKECKYYYADYYRGKSTQECRLIEANRASAPWKPALCQNCPVPDILQANGSPNLVLRGEVGKSMLGLLQKVRVTPYCREHKIEIKNPKTGCDQCRARTSLATAAPGNKPGKVG
jgi:hypothetical protein